MYKKLDSEERSAPVFKIGDKFVGYEIAKIYVDWYNSELLADPEFDGDAITLNWLQVL